MLAFPFSDSVVDLLSRRTVRMVYAAELGFRDGTARLHTGTGPMVIDGQTYLGVGNFGDVTSSRERLDSASPASVTITLSGLDAGLVADTLRDGCRGRPGRLLLVAIDEDGTYAADILFSGTLDAPSMSYAGSDGENRISVALTDRMADWQRPGTERWTDENHRSRHDGDRWFYAVAQLADWPIWWGSRKDAPSFHYPD